DTELATITTSGGLTIGTAANTGGITVVGTTDLVTPAKLTGGNLTLLSGGTGSTGIAVNANLTSPVNTVLNTDGNISIAAASGITATGKSVTLQSVSGAISENATGFVSANSLTSSSKTGTSLVGTNTVNGFNANNTT